MRILFADYEKEPAQAGLSTFFEESHESKHISDEQGPPKKRQKLAYTQSLTPPDTDVSGHESKPTNLKRVNERIKETGRARYTLNHLDDFFTLARVDLELVSCGKSCLSNGELPVALGV